MNQHMDMKEYNTFGQYNANKPSSMINYLIIYNYLDNLVEDIDFH